MNTTRKPQWLNKKVNLQSCAQLKRFLNSLNLNTVCQEARCPNIGECFSANVATFLILGKVCTRQCGFCAVEKGIPDAWDENEPKRIKQAVEYLGLKYLVITSVTRDDLEDGGAKAFADTIKELRSFNKDIKLEVLVPDFLGSISAIETVVKVHPDVFAHNLETVAPLYNSVRKGADYRRSLMVLEKAKQLGGKLFTKSGLMLGLGENDEQVIELLRDLRDAGCDFLSIGQYLCPSKQHFQVKSFVHPDRFLFFKQKAQEMGFLHVESAPYVRSSYIASAYLAEHSSSR